ncbi:bifunctional riboflavin kinase/FAD synthetase [Cytobacillus gottheilii]|uniref:bifunctional riboflavin kinase/FAD synthetase n=1 Tax=Cytobacillus gottheilii TaxID=859144 RepID=UPI0009BAE24B|nr:bifunctional riboflavin kinase/FAD synthetase [Cytobacillus gottheilii]
MKVIYIHHPHELKQSDFPELSIALGFFDGVHLGHQKVILEAKKTAEEKGVKSAVMTFDPHPSVVLGKSVQHVEYITPLDAKISLIEDLGIQYLFVVHFTKEFASLLPQEFADSYLIGLNVKYVTAGFDYSYGKMGRGTMETLPFHSRSQFQSAIVPKLEWNEGKISSTKIRSMIAEGETAELPALLGRHYMTSGVVIHGDKRGRTIGFPTANVEHADEYLIPPTGVYAVNIQVEGKWHEGVCNIGYKPTFHNEKMKKPSVEVHIFEFNEDIYGKTVTIEWHKHLRSERKFAGIDELVNQINQDKAEAAQYLKEVKEKQLLGTD